MKKTIITIIGAVLFLGTIAGNNLNQLSNWSSPQAVGFNIWTLFCLLGVPYIVFMQFRINRDNNIKKSEKNHNEDNKEKQSITKKETKFECYLNKYFFYIALGFLVIIILIIYLNNSNNPIQKDTSSFSKVDKSFFDKKLKCSEKIDLIKQDLAKMKQEKGSSIVGSYDLEEVFYSSKVDSCLFAYSYREEVCGLNYGCAKPADYEYIDGFVIKDFLSNKVLSNKINSSYNKATTLDDFRREIEKLK